MAYVVTQWRHARGSRHQTDADCQTGCQDELEPGLIRITQQACLQLVLLPQRRASQAPIVLQSSPLSIPALHPCGSQYWRFANRRLDVDVNEIGGCWAQGCSEGVMHWDTI